MGAETLKEAVIPTSELDNIPYIIRAAQQIDPLSVLDLGCGSGKYGVLLREYLDIAQGRPFRKDWAVKIDGVEGFREYVNELHAAVYDNVHVETFGDPGHHWRYCNYDLVLMIDSLEHLDRHHGEALLSSLRKYNKHVIVSCPWGASYLAQGAVYGNELERHRAHWHPNDFRSMGAKILHTGVCCVAHFSQ